MTMPPLFALEIPSDVTELAGARAGIRGWLTSEVDEPTIAADLLAVASEFLLHAIVRSGGTGSVYLVGERRAGGVHLAVRASIPAHAKLRRLCLPDDPLAPGALGRRMVEECCDDVRISAGGTAAAECWRGVA